MTERQLAVLGAIRRVGSPTVNALAVALGRNRAGVRRHVRKLVALGIVRIVDGAISILREPDGLVWQRWAFRSSMRAAPSWPGASMSSRRLPRCVRSVRPCVSSVSPTECFSRTKHRIQGAHLYESLWRMNREPGWSP